MHTFGSPPVPRAISNAKDPVDITGTSLWPCERPSHIIAPFPNADVIWSIAWCNAKSFFDIFSSPESVPLDFDFFLAT